MIVYLEIEFGLPMLICKTYFCLKFFITRMEQITALQPSQLQKQPFADVLQNSYSLKFRNTHRKTTMLESLFNKVASFTFLFFYRKIKELGVIIKLIVCSVQPVNPLTLSVPYHIETSQLSKSIDWFLYNGEHLSLMG